MNNFFSVLTDINSAIKDFVWVKSGLFLLIGTGILMTVLTRFFQITHIKEWVKSTIGSLFSGKTHKKEGHGSVSQFQALCTALAATIGTGNIAGVAAAIALGGPGAVFWMWLAAFFGMMTNFAENVLGIYYRRKNEKGEWSGALCTTFATVSANTRAARLSAKFLQLPFQSVRFWRPSVSAISVR